MLAPVMIKNTRWHGEDSMRVVRTVDSMKEAIEGISLVIAHTQSLAHTPVTRPSSEGSFMENFPHDAELKGSFPPLENHVTSSSNAYTSVESLDQYLSRVSCNHFIPPCDTDPSSFVPGNKKNAQEK
ncbi:uncharacterized protein RHO17_005237 isoform 1-T1 [Thomomys bottae]